MANPKYQVVIKDFADTTTFGPGDVIAILENATNVGWGEYLNEVGEAFFTLSQEDRNVSLLGQAMDEGWHCEIYRDGVQVFGGWLGESDENYKDVVFTAYSYISGFYHYVMEWDKEWLATDADEIVEDAYDYAVGLTKSRVGWLTKGTVENLWVQSGGSTTLALPFYRAPYKRALTIFREIAAYAISDTTNRVKFQVTPAGIFRLHRNDKTELNDVRWKLGDGKVRGFRRIRLPVDRRNEILAVGASPRDTILRETITKTVQRDAYGLKQEPIYFSWVRNATQLQRVTRIRAKKAVRVDTDLYLSFFKNTVLPFRSGSADYQLGDTVTVVLDRGATSLTGSADEKKIVVGQQVIFSGGSEFVRVLLADDL